MDWMYLVWFLLGMLLFWGSKAAAKGGWNEDATSLEQTKVLQGIMILGIALHHMAQKTCASWHPAQFRVHGLDFFLPLGYLFVGVFLFCSGLGLYKSLHTKPDYLKGFCRRRILPLVIAFYLSEFIYTGVRLLMGEPMDLLHILWNLSGLHMANGNAWYMIVMPFFYLAFWAAFRLCKKREGAAIFLVFIFTLAYSVLCAAVGHQDDWWVRGEWWYNSILLFPIGLLFGRFEKKVTRFFRRGYWIWLAVSFAAMVATFLCSEYMVDHVWGYYSAGSLGRRIGYSLLSACTQWLAALAFVAFWFLLMMKLKLGNKALAWLGGMTLEFYLMHGLFVDMFGYSFMDVAKSLVYIKNVPLYMAVVLACSVLSSILFRCLRKGVAALPAAVRNRRQKTGKRQSGLINIRKWIVPVLALLLMTVGFLLLKPDRNPVRVVGGLKVTPPAGYELQFTDSRYTKWKYTGSEGKPGYLVLDKEIRGYNADSFDTVEDVMNKCDWMTGKEIYVNPYGIRMVRGFSESSSGDSERRYYVECDSAMFLLSMIEDSRYYDLQDCENAMQQTADNICR